MSLVSRDKLSLNVKVLCLVWLMPTSSSGSQIGDENESIFCSKCKKVFQDVDELELHEKKCFVGR